MSRTQSVVWPEELYKWLKKQCKKSGRTFSGEVVYLLTLIKEGRLK